MLSDSNFSPSEELPDEDCTLCRKVKPVGTKLGKIIGGEIEPRVDGGRGRPAVKVIEDQPADCERESGPTP